jgi:hypothetical protein
MPAGALEESTSRLAAISAEFFEQVGRRPTLGELLELLGWSSHSIFSAPLTFKVKFLGNRRYESPGDSLVDELNDSIFVDAAEFLSFLARVAGDQPVSPSGLTSALALALKSASISLQDVGSEEVAGLTSSILKKTAKPRIGDILAIPAKGGGYRMAAVVARNRFGTALGVLCGRCLVPRVRKRENLAVRRFPLYTDDRLVSTGTWKVIGHDEGLLSLFSEDPEIYHAPDLQWPGIDLGKFGAAESPAGTIRLIGAEEASEVGLIGGVYQQTYMGEVLQQLLDDQPDC